MEDFLIKYANIGLKKPLAMSIFTKTMLFIQNGNRQLCMNLNSH